MRRFTCGVCGAHAEFTSQSCDTCTTALGFVPALGDLRPLTAVTDIAYALVIGPGHDHTGDAGWWRCLNAAWGCNWVLPADSGDVWCASCRLTRGRPDESSPDAVSAWSAAEAAKRQLVAQLLSLGLSVDGVVFDLVHLPDSRGVTGHRPGVVTLDLREVDDAFREGARLHFGEPDRTVLGHLRHEIGHHYFDVLVAREGRGDEFRSLFGDERADYGAALTDHYDQHDPVEGAEPVPDTHISTYATVHPSEDWAECFAHYLHLRDGLETADAFGLMPGNAQPAGSTSADPFVEMIRRWRHLAPAINQLNRGLGHRAPYPYAITAPVEAKLAFVHDMIARRSSAG